jgi:hypothetical protein
VLCHEIKNLCLAFGISGYETPPTLKNEGEINNAIDFTYEVQCLSFLKSTLEQRINLLENEIQTLKEDFGRKERDFRNSNQESNEIYFSRNIFKLKFL